MKGIEIFKGRFLWGNERFKTDSSEVNGVNEKKKLTLKRTERDCFTRVM